jgi:hypothetical protein
LKAGPFAATTAPLSIANERPKGMQHPGLLHLKKSHYAGLYLQFINLLLNDKSLIVFCKNGQACSAWRDGA